MKWKRSYGIVIILAVLAVAAAMVADRVKDRVIREIICRSIEEASGLEVSLESFRYNVFRTEFELRGFTLKNPSSFGVSDAIRIDRLYIDTTLPALISKNRHLRLCEIDIGFINIIDYSDSKSNFEIIADLFDGPATEAVPDEMPAAERPPEAVHVATEPREPEDDPVDDVKVSIDLLRIHMKDARIELSSAPGQRPMEMTVRIDSKFEYRDVDDLDKVLDEILIEILGAAGPQMLFEIMTSPDF